jgi:hypothetical protein
MALSDLEKQRRQNIRNKLATSYEPVSNRAEPLLKDQMLPKRFNTDDINKLKKSSITNKLQTLNNTSSNYNKLAEADNNQPAPLNNLGQVRMTNDGLSGDVAGARKRIQANRRKQYSLSNLHKQKQDGSYDVNRLNVKFAPGTDNAARERFLNVPTGGGRGPRLGYDPSRTTYGPRQIETSSNNGLPSKKGMTRSQYQQLLENKGALDVQELRNQGALSTRGLQNLNEIETQKLRNQGIIQGQEIINDRTLAIQAAAQKNLQAKNDKEAKKANRTRLKNRYELIQKNLDNFLGSPEERIALEAKANEYRKEYERSLNAGTTGDVNDQMAKYLQ